MKKFAVFGNPIKQSLSPQIHAAFAHQAGIDIEYTKQFSELADFEHDLQAFFNQKDVCGCNITAPFKSRAFDVIDKLHASGEQAGAINTIHKDSQGLLHGHNTDGAGLVLDLQRILGSIANLNVLVLGAGGAVRGVINPLLNAGVASLAIHNRTYAKAMAMVDEVACGGVSVIEKLCSDNKFDVVINGTSSSLTKAIPDFGEFAFTGVELTYDMSYASEPTPIMSHALTQGCKSVSDGLGMLVGQAAEAFNIWTGFMPETECVLHSIRKRIS